MANFHGQLVFNKGLAAGLIFFGFFQSKNLEAHMTFLSPPLHKATSQCTDADVFLEDLPTEVVTRLLSDLHSAYLQFEVAKETVRRRSFPPETSVSEVQMEEVIRDADSGEMLVGMKQGTDTNAIYYPPVADQKSIYDLLTPDQRVNLVNFIAKVLVRSDYLHYMVFDEGRSTIESVKEGTGAGIDPDLVVARNLYEEKSFMRGLSGGTCRQGASVFAAKLLSLGFPKEEVRYKFYVEYIRRQFTVERDGEITKYDVPGEKGHVSVEVKLNGEWVEFDTTPDNQNLEVSSEERWDKIFRDEVVITQPTQ